MSDTYKRDLERTEKKKKKKSKRKSGRQAMLMKIGAGFLIGLAMLVVVLVAGLFFMRYRGEKQLKENTIGSVAEMQMQEMSPEKRENASGSDNGYDVSAGFDSVRSEKEDEKPEEKEGRVFYQGKTYDFNRDILTFLCMGIDQRSEKVREYTEGFEGGSADAVFLLVLNPHTKKMQIVAIDRNTMTDVDIYDYYGNYEETIETQLCVQHGFGDGTVKSAEYMEKAVSNLLYGLPINGYCAINMSAIPKINDAVGGVDVKVLDDLTKWDKTLQKDAEVHLMGKSAFWYVKARDTDIFGSASGRLERQKQYLTAYVKRAKAEFKKDPTLALTLFQALKDYMTTDINAEKVTYLATLAAGFDFSEMDMKKIPGETVMGDQYEEYYVDETGMYELILDVFYEEVTKEEAAE